MAIRSAKRLLLRVLHATPELKNVTYTRVLVMRVYISLRRRCTTLTS